MAPKNVLTVIDNRTTKRYEIPIVKNAIKAVDIKQIKNTDLDSGLVVYDAGLRNTAVVSSGVSDLNGKTGTLHFRGLSISSLFHQQLQYEDSLHLLVWGSLPSPEQKARLRSSLWTAMDAFPIDDVSRTLHSFPSSAPPMPMIIGGLAAYLSSRPNTIPAITGANLYENAPDAVEAQIVPTVAALCIIVAITYCRRAGRPLRRPSPHLSFAANFFHMMNLSISDQQLVRLEQLWLLYADHGLSNATANFLQTASTRADPVTCLIAALSAGSGPLHGGAIDMIYHMLEGVGDKTNVPALLNDVKQGKTRLYGFGHRIYNTLDPRAPLVKEILASFDLTKYPIIGVANEIERLASRDEWFQARQVEMNVDLYSGFPYIALGLPPEIIFPIITIARAQGFTARWKEFMLNKPPIWRPQQIYTGEIDPSQKSKL